MCSYFDYVYIVFDVLGCGEVLVFLCVLLYNYSVFSFGYSGIDINRVVGFFGFFFSY